MISKRKLKGRLYDICHGAGLVWQKEDRYFDDFCMANLREAIHSIEDIFNLGSETRLRNPYHWEEFEDLDTMTDLQEQ